MIKRLLPLLLASAFAAPAWSQSEPAPQVSANAGRTDLGDHQLPVEQPGPAAGVPAEAEASDTQEKVVVVGQRPGPGLWKVSKGDNVLWVFGTYGPLPTKMHWRSHEVESILAKSQEVLAPPSATPKLGLFQMAKMVPHAFGLMKNPDGKTLKDVLPADVYARWELMKKQYMPGKDDVERQRPLFAAERLYSAALYKAGLTSKNEVSSDIEKLVKKSKIKVTRTEVELAVENPAGLMKAFKKSPMEDAACLSKTMDRIEMDMEVLKVRANAWSKGDVGEIRKLNFTDRRGPCKDAMMSNPVFREGIKVDDMESRMREAWLAAAENALARNASTFAILSIREMLDSKGMLAALEAKGYQVESPE